MGCRITSSTLRLNSGSSSEITPVVRQTYFARLRIVAAAYQSNVANGVVRGTKRTLRYQTYATFAVLPATLCILVVSKPHSGLGVAICPANVC